MLSKQNPGQHQWEHRLVQPLRKPAGRIIKRLTLQLSYITAVYITQQCFLLHSRRKCNPYVEEFPESLPWKSENIAQPLHTRSQAKLKYSSTNIIYPQEPVSLSGTFIELLAGTLETSQWQHQQVFTHLRQRLLIATQWGPLQLV